MLRLDHAFEIMQPTETDPNWYAVDKDGSVTFKLESNGSQGAKMRHRVAHEKHLRTGEVNIKRALFAELSGVRLYAMRDGMGTLHLIMTERDLNL